MMVGPVVGTYRADTIYIFIINELMKDSGGALETEIQRSPFSA